MKDDIRKILNKCPQCNDTEIADVEHCHDCSGWDTGHCDCGGSPVQCNCQEAKIAAMHDLFQKILEEEHSGVLNVYERYKEIDKKLSNSYVATTVDMWNAIKNLAKGARE